MNSIKSPAIIILYCRARRIKIFVIDEMKRNVFLNISGRAPFIFLDDSL